MLVYRLDHPLLHNTARVRAVNVNLLNSYQIVISDAKVPFLVLTPK